MNWKAAWLATMVCAVILSSTMFAPYISVLVIISIVIVALIAACWNALYGLFSDILK